MLKRYIVYILGFMFFCCIVICSDAHAQQSVAARNHYKVAKNHFTLGKYSEAEKELAESLKLDGHYSDSLFLMALTKWQLKKLDDAQKYIEQVMRQEPRYFIARLYYASILTDRNELSKAEEQIKFYITNNPSDAQGYYAQGVIRYKKGDPQSALESWDKALSLDKKHVYSHYNKGIALEALGKHKEALASLAKALELKSNNSNKYRFAIAAIKYNSDDKKDALKDFKYLSELIPSTSEGLVSAAYLALDAAEWDEALKKAEEALKSEPDFVEALKVKAAVLESTEKYEEAAQLLEIIYKKDPNQKFLQSRIETLRKKAQVTKESSLPVSEGEQKNSVNCESGKDKTK